MDIKLSCNCGEVQGLAIGVNPNNGTRVVCCCKDCQSFATYLGVNSITDKFGGTDIYQTSQSQIRIFRGLDKLKCARLKPKGLFRWYAGCCKTPVGNTTGPGMPLIGIFHNFMQHEGDRTQELGPVLAFTKTVDAIGTLDYPRSAENFPLGIVLRMVRKTAWWKVRGKHKPSPFFEEDGTPIVEPTII